MFLLLGPPNALELAQAAAGASGAPAQRRGPLPNSGVKDEQGKEVCRQFFFLGKCTRGNPCPSTHVQGFFVGAVIA